jgi:hypothetical protein
VVRTAAISLAECRVENEFRSGEDTRGTERVKIHDRETYNGYRYEVL